MLKRFLIFIFLFTLVDAGYASITEEDDEKAVLQIIQRNTILLGTSEFKDGFIRIGHKRPDLLKELGLLETFHDLCIKSFKEKYGLLMGEHKSVSWQFNDPQEIIKDIDIDFREQAVVQNKTYLFPSQN